MPGAGGRLKLFAKELGNSEDTLSGTLICCGAVFLVAVLVYANSLTNGFVWDDVTSLPHGVSGMTVCQSFLRFFHDIWGVTNGWYYRPFIGFLYSIEYLISSGMPWSFHLFNILFHAANCVLVFLIVVRLLGEYKNPTVSPEKLAFAAAALFATHPIHTESVAWISGITDPSYTFFLLLALYYYLRFVMAENRKKAWRIYPIILVGYFLATLCKEPGVTLPVILIAYDMSCGRSYLSLKPLELIKRHLPIFLVAGIYLTLRLHAISGLAPGANSQGLVLDAQNLQVADPTLFLLNVISLFAHYIQKVVIPLNLTAYYHFQPLTSYLSPTSLALMTAFVLFLILVCLAFRKERVTFFSIILFAIPLLPALNFHATGTTAFAERYLYLPSLGFILLVVVGAGKTLNHWPEKRGVITAVALLLVCIYAGGAIKRNLVWRDDLTLWSDTVEKSPESFLCHYNLGNELWKRGRMDEAAIQYYEALRINSRFARAHMQLGLAYGSKGVMSPAISEMELAVMIEPGNAEIRYNFGIVLLAAGMTTRGIEVLERTLEIKPDYAKAHYKLGVAYRQIGQLNRALVHLQTAVDLQPETADYRLCLANVVGQLRISSLTGH